MLGERAHFVELPIWEMGHVGWFQEYWILRHLTGAAPQYGRRCGRVYENPGATRRASTRRLVLHRGVIDRPVRRDGGDDSLLEREDLSFDKTGKKPSLTRQ